jgi:hypothetical protein
LFVLIFDLSSAFVISFGGGRVGAG